MFFLIGCGISVVEKEERGLIIPAYFYNQSLWDKVVNASIDEMVIVNPANGPGSLKDEKYEKFISDLVAYDKRPIGYVYTKWGDRDIDLVKDDIDTWFELYPQIEGFFIDETATGADKLDYYKDLYDYIKSKGDFFVVLNPGTMPISAYFKIADNIVVYEGEAKKLPNESCNIYADKSSIIVYNATEEQMREIISVKHCKYLYITDENDSNPYDDLPSYFDKEIDALK